MSWSEIIANINGKDYACHVNDGHLSIPYDINLIDCDISIKIDDVAYNAIDLVNIADRNEIILIKLRESDESAPRANKHKSGRKELSGKTDA